VIGRLALAAVLVVLMAWPARADDQALARVIAEAASVRTGPGFGYRVVYRANQGEVLTVIGRATKDHWFRVELPDGTYGWILGDEVFPLDVDMAAAHEGPSVWKRFSHAVFSPSPLMTENVTFTFSAGVLGGDGMFLFRPAVLLAPHVSLEAVRRRDGRQPGRRHLHGGRLQRLPVPDVAPDAVRGRRRGRRVRAASRRISSRSSSRGNR
jgi:hypothetical protein